MSYKTITVIMTDLKADRAALDVAYQLALKEEGHLDVICLGIDRTQPGFYYTGVSAVALQTSLAEAEEEAAALEKGVINILEGAPLAWSTVAMATPSAGLSQLLSYRLRFSDIAVLPRPYGKGRTYENEAIVEAALFDAEIPVLVIPEGGSLPVDINRVVIGWNDSREALHAVRHALPLLRAASVVNIAIVDPPAHAPDRSDPGGALSQMLSRHGANPEVSVLAKTLPRVSDVLKRHVADQGAQMLVMGAYGHSRFRESILGGATRNTLEEAEVPVFMAH